jgi:hypothetical protein
MNKEASHYVRLFGGNKIANLIFWLLSFINFGFATTETQHWYTSLSMGSNDTLYELRIFRRYFCVLPYWREMIRLELTVGVAEKNCTWRPVEMIASVEWGSSILHCDSIHDCLPSLPRRLNCVTNGIKRGEGFKLCSSKKVKTFRVWNLV